MNKKCIPSPDGGRKIGAKHFVYRDPKSGEQVCPCGRYPKHKAAVKK